MRSLSECLPLVSVVIPTYNYAHFLSTAISSVLRQSYTNIEIIVIDDGSQDDTGLVVKNFPAVQYFYQKNKGLSAARNAGIAKSTGDYLVFLDADDWLEHDAIEQHIKVIQQNPGVAFISGNYYLLRAGAGKPEPVSVMVSDNHYTELLGRNYIGMHAAVMFKRWVFQEIRYDETLQACEDYDLYLRIARKYPVLHHQRFIATYYFHARGMSHNHPLMIQGIQAVMEKQRPFVVSDKEQAAYQKGLVQWEAYHQLMKELH